MDGAFGGIDDEICQFCVDWIAFEPEPTQVFDGGVVCQVCGHTFSGHSAHDFFRFDTKVDDGAEVLE